MKTTYPFRPDDLQDLAARGIALETALSQIETFKRGLPFITLRRPCTVGDGITALSPADLARYSTSHERAAGLGRVTKFVPASGAASRMFQLLLSVVERASTLSEEQIVAAALSGDRECQAAQQLLSNLKHFAFFDDLRGTMARDDLDMDALISRQHCKAILQYLLTPVGLDYASLPKALIKFHRYADHTRTAAEEHLLEAVAYAQDSHGVARAHFTVSPEHRAAVQEHLERVQSRYERDGQRLAMTFSVQKPSTDTIAVDHDNAPFRTTEGKLVFRPGGHGALLANLQDLQGDIVFIKNIDNVVPDRLKAETYRYKRALGGYLVELQNKMFAYLSRLLQARNDARLLAEVMEFARQELSLVPPTSFQQATSEEKHAFLVGKLNRPLRVCGVVKNTGEPGGGPFWVAHANGEVSVQIVESSQVDLQSARQQAIWASASHFNPVDLVCGVRDHLGRSFDLSRFADPDTGFIARKSKDGRELKALELPGLWNGAMARWNTVFVEVPAITFNPVKTVFDLLRPEHHEDL
jgi:hypothetical protein